MRVVACFVLFLITSLSVHAEPDIEKRKNAERLMTIMKLDTMMDTTYSQIEQMATSMTEQLGVKDSEGPIFDKYMAKIRAAMREELAWDKIKESMIDIYVRRFTQDELTDLVAFYETKSGKSIIEKMPLVMKDSMQASQLMLVEFFPKIQTISREYKEELQAARNAK